MADTQTGAENVRWDLSFLYKGIDDPQIDADVSTWVEGAKRFFQKHKGNLTTTLPQALSEFIELSALSDKITYYLFLSESIDILNPKIKAKTAETEQKINNAQGEYLTFFEIELVALSDETLEALYKKDALLEKYRPWIKHARVFKPHLLSEPVEGALSKRTSFGAGAWSEFFHEVKADLSFPWKEGTKTLTEILHIWFESSDKNERALAMKITNDGLGGSFAKYATQTLYMVVGSKAVETNERKYKNPMTLRNKGSRIPDEVVDALHRAVMEEAAPLARRFYKLKANLLGLPVLAWSDKNAPIPFSDTRIVPYDEGVKKVIAAYHSFSPTLAGLVQEFVDKKRIDAPAMKGKRGGAYNASTLIPNNVPMAMTLLNYLGSNRDVMTLAHEVGHGVHGILSAKAQGGLMMHHPVAYSETASVFGEMTTFNFLRKELAEKKDDKALLALLVEKLDDMMNTVVRQIGLSNLERRIHGMDETYTMWDEPKKLSVPEINTIWLTTLKELYGEEGDVFTYENTEYLWTYIYHLHRPFYVYAYVFGELFTQSIYAKKEELGARFEPLYLDMLSSGMTRDVIELTKPFGLDPTHTDFWTNGIRIGMETLLTEAEALAQKIKNP